MTNEELKAKAAALTSVEDAYALAKECGFTGSLEDFKAACAKAADQNEQMDLDAMDSVAGGSSLSDLLGDGRLDYSTLNVLLGPIKPFDLVPQIVYVEE